MPSTLRTPRTHGDLLIPVCSKVSPGLISAASPAAVKASTLILGGATGATPGRISRASEAAATRSASVLAMSAAVRACGS